MRTVAFEVGVLPLTDTFLAATSADAFTLASLVLLEG